ncbi:MAG: hypothetical protein ACK4X1_16915 [Terricaulis sp.]
MHADSQRLVFAYHVRAGWIDVEWYGQTGSDLGRDVVGVHPFDGRAAEKTVIQCVNREELTLAKAIHDMSKAAKAPTGRPDAFKFVSRGAVSAERRDAIRKAGAALNIPSITIWSGAEFEEYLRLRAEDLLKRFCAGEEFPEAISDIKKLVDDFATMADDEALALMAAVFDRPAFRTRFHLESSLPAFQQAIEDTIRALNTGVWRTREGAEIRRIPSLHHLTDPAKRGAVGVAVERLDRLRQTFVSHIRSGRIRHCGCSNLACPVFMVDDDAARSLDHARQEVFAAFRAVWPSFDVELRADDE